MAIEKMALVNIAGLSGDLDKALEVCCDSGYFHIEPAISSDESGGMHMLNEKNPYGQALKDFLQLAVSLDIKLKETDYTGCKAQTPSDFENEYRRIDEGYVELENKHQELSREMSELDGAIKQITHLGGLNSDFKRIFSCRHVAVRVGKLPTDNVQKLDYYNEDFFFVPFETGRNFCWGMYFCPIGEKDVVDEIFRSMYFERMRVPDYVTGNGQEALKSLGARMSECKSEFARVMAGKRQISRENEKDIQQAYSKLKKCHDMFELRKKAAEFNGKFYLKGFIPDKDKDDFEKRFDKIKSAEAFFMPADADASCTPPTVLKNGWFTRPFRMMVGMYGLPDYDGFNPTAFVAITYSLLFGIMFGDLGQGFLVWLLGMIVGKKVHKDAGGMIARVGISSMIFGTLYGSVFGFEDFLTPLYEAAGITILPLRIFKNTNFILIAAVVIGILLIMISMILNIIIGFKKKDYEKAIFGCNGIAGFVFYSSVIAGLVATIVLKVKIMSAPFVIFLIVIPLICIFCRVPFSIAVKYKEFRLSDEEEKTTVGTFIVENFFEMFEFLLSYISNTMSFFRVGGFVLSHAGMMLVVMTLMEGFGAIGQPIVLILGNAFVMVLEGLLVAIQIIRLEFYEMFSRFYEGDGKEYEPCGVKFSAQSE